MKKESAGLLMCRKKHGMLEYFLVHPGGPFWKNKDEGTWGIPKGHVEEGEDKLVAAIREFKEETGFEPVGPYTELNSVEYHSNFIKSQKKVYAWAFFGDCDPSTLRSNECEIEFPPRSGKKIMIPEIDRGEFFTLETAKTKIHPAHLHFLEEAEKILK